MKKQPAVTVATFVCAAAIALVGGGLLAWGFARPGWYCRGGMAVGVTSGRLEVAWSSGAVSRGSIAWDLRGSEGSASILVGDVKWWRPGGISDSIGNSPSVAGAPLFTLTVIYLPLWPVVALSGGTAGWLWWRWRRMVLPGHCAACGYDLRGLNAGRCPECGKAGIVARMIAAVLRRGARGAPVMSV